jgi:hypothetical protein
VVEEWEEFRLISRDPDVWDDVWGSLLSLDRQHHDRLRAILERCCEMSTEYISGQGGLFQVLTAEEMLDSDVAAARDDRRVADGFVSPADARAFLELARRGEGEGGGERDPITRAYFRGLSKPAGEPKQEPRATPKPAKPVNELAALLREAEVIAPPPAQPLAALTDGASAKSHLGAPVFEQAMSDLRERDPELFSARMRELGYLVNVWISGGAHDGRRPRPVEAMEMVLRTCEAGMRTQLPAEQVRPEQALAALAVTPADVLFRRGFRDTTGHAPQTRRAGRRPRR